MHLPARLVALVVGALFVVAACGSSTTTTATPTSPLNGSAPPKASFLPQPVTEQIGVGPNRLVYGLVDSTGTKPIGAPDRTLSVGFTGPSGESIPAAPATFIWAIEDSIGVYVVHATFPVAGTWTASFTSAAPSQPAETLPFSFDVLQHTTTVAPGDPAPSVKTPTLSDVGGDVTKVSTDANPVPRFYETSEDAALAAKKPFVIVFATPKFCQSKTCGPTLDKVKPIAAAHPDVTFINVEPYQLKDEGGSLQPVLDANNQLIPVEATTAFKLISEPYVFVVGADGKVSASFELVFSPEELESAVKAVEG
ncbi:MAG TPA: hypothetical protein VH440_06895 [Candidatus Limnocylindrales bacterium]